MLRNIERYLATWRHDKLTNPTSRKPLIVRGARQVGKSYSIEAFGKSAFTNYIRLDLEKTEHAALFTEVVEIKDLLTILELKFNQQIVPGKTLLFIDEIQNSPIALQQLRYFHQELPQLHVIAAGSLLDVVINKSALEIPVGRVEYCYMHPLTFDEFLLATGKERCLEQLKSVRIDTIVPTAQHNLFLKYFLEYVVVGGMPEIVARYSAGESLHTLSRVYESLLVGFRDDISKYASQAQSVYLRHCLENTPLSVGMQIAYNHFAESGFRSREISTAFDVLELAQLVYRVFSSRSLGLPLVSNRKKAPKLIFLDVGLVNYKLGQREQISSTSSLEGVFRGQISEQIVGQTLLSFSESTEQQIVYWYRDKKGSNAEVDYLLAHGSGVVPLEVKAGKRAHNHQSLNVVIDEFYKNGQQHPPLAVMVHSAAPTFELKKTASGNQFRLLTIPYYLLFRIHSLIEQMEKD